MHVCIHDILQRTQIQVKRLGFNIVCYSVLTYVLINLKINCKFMIV